MSNIAKLLGERIRNIRKNRNWSQEELAHRADINRSYMGEIERGETNVTIDSLEKVARAFEMTLEELFKYLQPSFESKDNEALAALINKVSNLSHDNQKTILELIDAALRIKP